MFDYNILVSLFQQLDQLTQEVKLIDDDLRRVEVWVIQGNFVRYKVIYIGIFVYLGTLMSIFVL